MDLPREEPWDETPVLIAPAGARTSSGFTAGATIWVRVRKIDTKGQTGGWSDPASIMVT